MRYLLALSSAPAQQQQQRRQHAQDKAKQVPTIHIAVTEATGATARADPSARAGTGTGAVVARPFVGLGRPRVRWRLPSLTRCADVAIAERTPTRFGQNDGNSLCCCSYDYPCGAVDCGGVCRTTLGGVPGETRRSPLLCPQTMLMCACVCAV